MRFFKGLFRVWAWESMAISVKTGARGYLRESQRSSNGLFSLKLKIRRSNIRTGSTPVSGTTSEECCCIPFPRFWQEPRKLHLRSILPPSPHATRYLGLAWGPLFRRSRPTAQKTRPPRSRVFFVCAPVSSFPRWARFAGLRRGRHIQTESMIIIPLNTRSRERGQRNHA